ncbi:hypothetical protein [Rhizobium laguerreae]|uniref:DUF1311 domain-containing protein n=1 Tax=Rhizobium laguerreae TaxID=1076926 RepID=A0A7Y2W6N3_9HYPH|nr:hypothetical protein [Rhizobium laguerreae]NNH41886.1 hypothetical protein [Rhizobium laguerreae]NNH57095.1 hypothetical protein [Rhizobium laguerreae]NNH65510.1 hypothetical protein [Rhizobium laguerreae]
MRTVKWLLVMLVALVAYPVLAQQNQRENQQRTCEAVLGKSLAAAECKKVFAKDADCCIQYDAERLAKLCAKMSSIETVLTCFSEIHEVGFWKTDLTDEPGLGAQHAEQWKKNVMRECMKETTTAASLDCAVLQKSGTKFVYGQKNDEIARQATVADPIMQFCRNAFGDYWEGVEQCVKDQRAAKKRLGL